MVKKLIYKLFNEHNTKTLSSFQTMRSLTRLTAVFTGRSLHSTRPLINHQLHTKKSLPTVDFPAKSKSSSLASQIKQFTNEYNEDKIRDELDPLIDFILSPPKSGLKRKEIHVHPTANKGKFKMSNEEQNYKYFMDLEEEHVKYLRSEGLKGEEVTYKTSTYTSDNYPQYDPIRYDYPYYKISWYE